MDLSQRLPFYIKRPQVHVAVQKGIVFELKYRSAVMGGQHSNSGGGIDARRNFIQNALSLLRTTRGKNIIVSEISRGDSFGGSNIFRTPGLDYLGDIVAGDQILGTASPKPVVCYYLSPSDFKLIPDYEIRTLSTNMQYKVLPFMQIGCRKFKVSTAEITTY